MEINIIGKGNIAWHLNQAFIEGGNCDSNETFTVTSVNSRTLDGLSEKADFTILAVSDGAIADVASRLCMLEGIVAHTSGSTSIEVLNGLVKRPGVFYPLQTFTKGAAIDYSRVPLFLEATNQKDLEILKSAAQKFSSNVMQADSDVRRRLHLAAVFANNFTNHMVTLAQELLEHDGINPLFINPLLEETFAKLRSVSAKEAQTGPARRNDMKTIETHISMLSEYPDIQHIYKEVSNSILHCSTTVDNG